MPGVDACRKVGLGGVMRASRGDPKGCGVVIALCMALAPFVMWANPGEGICWRAACGCGDEVICWLSPEGVRDGICRTVRFRGDTCIEGDGIAGGGCGVGVPAGESLGDSRELISILTVRCASAILRALCVDARLDSTSFRDLCKHPRSIYVRVLRQSWD